MDNLTAIVSNTSDNCNHQHIQISCNNESSNTLIAKKTKNDLSKNTKMIKTDSTESSNSDSDEKEDYVSEVHKAFKEEITKLHEKIMSYEQIIQVLKKDALQNEKHWEKKYNVVQQQNEELNQKVKLLSDLNIEL